MQRYDSTYLIFQSDHGPRRDLLDLLSALGPGPHQLSEKQAEIAEVGARILLWMKPPGMSARESSSRNVQLHEIPSMLLEDLQLEPLANASRVAQTSAIRVLLFDPIDRNVGPLQLLRDPESARWRSQPWTDREVR